MTALSGRVAIVTGAAMGLGNSISQQLADNGATVAVLDINAAGAHAAADALTADGYTAAGYECDVANRANVDAVFEEVARDYGSIDILVNNAGVSHVGPLTQDTTDEAWHRSIQVMQTGVFYCMRSVSRFMLPRRSGAVVNISSVRGFTANPGRIAYCAAKAAVIMMTQVAAAEWGPYSVRVNSIAPGVQRTPMWDEDVRLGVCDEGKVLSATPLGTLGDPADVGRLAAYLCSDQARFITGSCIVIDGGMTSVPSDGTIIRPTGV